MEEDGTDFGASSTAAQEEMHDFQPTTQYSAEPGSGNTPDMNLHKQ